MADDEEDDEVYVVVELSGVIDARVLELAGKRCSILGVDTPEPVLKLGSYLFTGEYRDSIGTCVLFEETEAAGEGTSSATESRNSSCRQTRQKPPKELRRQRRCLIKKTLRKWRSTIADKGLNASLGARV
ncbi:hypothetical protein HPB52_014371 [Rhipicephalus sanguineus]|uniref:Transcription factor TFIIIC triple barrel domain-containing protein n=1 Tax=Rhipicephalus sanguineus TaxID=34632 RepID=A0A9D4SXF7_RHISA|nr:hypothetical protein HPB52_014371 [Rhipicephalus sanguineus]